MHKNIAVKFAHGYDSGLEQGLFEAVELGVSIKFGDTQESRGVLERIKIVKNVDLLKALKDSIKKALNRKLFLSWYLHSLLKQVGVCFGSFKNNFIRFDDIDQQPIRFNVTFTSPLPIADQLMIPVNGVKRFFRCNRTNDYF